MGVLPKIRGTVLGVTIIRIVAYWGPPTMGNYPICLALKISMGTSKGETPLTYHERLPTYKSCFPWAPENGAPRV